LYGAPPGAAAAVPHASYAAPYAALLNVGYAAYNVSPTYAGYIASNADLSHAGHTAFYVTPPASAQTWAPSSPTEWVFNSGATAHLSKDAGILHSLSPHPVYCHVIVGDGSSVLVMPLFHLFYLTVLFICATFLLHLALLKIVSPSSVYY
jgi:hypothetical protein